MNIPDEAQPIRYEAENADKIVSDLFSGNLSIEQALQRLRTRLLDLSSRNRLLNYRYPKGRSIQFVDKPNLNLVFNRLIDGKSPLLKYVLDPPPATYTVKRPDVKTYAQSIGIDIDTEFSPASCGSCTKKHTPKLQTLYYPADLDRLCRKLSSDARMVIEETGTNMLYAIFGFLEFYEHEDSEKTMLAPLLAVPITLEKGAIDHETRTYQYSITYSGEDIHENHTLREKLNRDFSLQLPEFEEEDEPGTYFTKIQVAVQNKKRWKVRYQFTLGFLSFGKLAIWDDLDPKKWPGLLQHPLLKEVFAGGSGKGASLFPEDYDIDNHPQGDLPLIYDADSSQHSAIIDVLSGKNMVINGPPGTGKSQTITNVIAAGLKAGKKILFVSEKLAALEVVRRRLNQANMGHFCLELHSHKTRKKKLLGELQERMDERFRPPQQLQDKICTLERHKKDLNRYAELMASRVGNELGFTVHEVFWRIERRRQAIGDLANAVQSLFLVEAPTWAFDDIELRRVKLEVLGQMYTTIGSYDSTHPWWGFTPKPLAPGDNEAIGRIIREALSLANELSEVVLEYYNKTGADKEPPLAALEHFHRAFQALPEPPSNLKGDLLPRVFSCQNPQDKHNRELLASVIHKVECARNLNLQAAALLAPNCELDYDSAASIVAACYKELAPSSFSVPLNTLEESVLAAGQALRRFESIITQAAYTFLPIQETTLETLDAKIKSVAPLALLNQPIQSIREGASTLFREAVRLGQSLEIVSSIAKRYNIKFDSSPAAVTHLSGPDGIEEILPGVLLDDEVIAKAQKAADSLLADLPITELDKRHQELHVLHDRISRLLDEIGGYAQQLCLHFDGTKKAVSHLAMLGQIAARAPVDLLDYRHPSLAQPRILDLVAMAEEAHASEQTQREHLAEEFYLDTLPSTDELKAAIRAFRRGDSLFNIFNSEWRAAKKLFDGICKTKAKYSAADCEAWVSSIVAWMEHHASFIGNDEFKDAFGPLFKGLDTDFSRIRCLATWYIESHHEMLKHPGFIESVDLSTLDSIKVSQLAALSPRLQVIVSELEECSSQVKQLLGLFSNQAEMVLSRSGWAEYNQKVLKVADDVKNVSTFLGGYVRQDVSPKRAIQVLNAKLEILSVRSDFQALNRGIEELHSVVKQLFPGIVSIPCHRWSDYLDCVSSLAHSASALVEFVCEYGNGEDTPSDILTFCEAKLALDCTLHRLAVRPEENVVQDWPSYISTAAGRIKAGARLVQVLKPVGEIGKSAKEVVFGLSYRRDANDLISGIANDTAVTAILQGLFQGIETNLDCVATTLSWGELISNNLMIRGASLDLLLLSSDAISNFYWIRETLQRINDLSTAVKSKLNELTEFGSFSWDAWNSVCHGQAKGYFANSLRERVEAAASATEAVLPWAKYNAERSTCKEIGLDVFLIGLEQKRLPSMSMGAVFEFVTYHSIGRSIYKSFPEMKGFSGANHEKKRQEFTAFDQEIIGLTGKSFAYEIDKTTRVPEGESGYRASERTEMQLLWHELGKRRRHLPIRQFIKRAGRAIMALKPCFMMGPMSVAQYLEQGAVEFDMVVMDEASQLRPEEALGAIVRGKQLVVVGDPKQLPPTNFFDRMLDAGDDDEDADPPIVLAGSESILDICQQMFHPVRTLRWHYRSQHESLIAFSNHHFYNGKLVVFPSPFDRNDRLGVRFRYIKSGVYKNRQNIPEALRLVDAAIEHMMKHPEESIGVVTLNQTQREIIEDLFDKKIRNIKEAQTFISNWEEEGWPFFVKNLENVQGDERDVIFISTTFGKAPGTDKPRQNFGPISRADGWRRLNVLFTRARRKIELFTSMLSEDIIVDNKTPAGTRALKDYLEFAKSGVLTNTSISSSDPDSDFEIAVGDMLQNRGYEVVPQLGVAGFFIDLAVRNPDRPGEFLVAVECDGATYHSSKSARDRDRIRQSILESLGWKDRIWRVWSTDWFYDPRRESERLLAFLEERRATVHSEPALDYGFEEEFDEIREAEQTAIAEVVNSTTEPSLSISEEDLFVEVGDRVTYCFVDKPEDRHHMLIVDTESNPRLNLINENTPLAKALLNSAVGDESEFEVKGNPTRIIRVLRIHRQNGTSEALDTAREERNHDSEGQGEAGQLRISFEKKPAAPPAHLEKSQALKPDSINLKRVPEHPNPIRDNEVEKKKKNTETRATSPSRPFIDSRSVADPFSETVMTLLPDEQRHCPACHDRMALSFGMYAPYLKCPKCGEKGEILHPTLFDTLSKLQPPCEKCGRPMLAVEFHGRVLAGCSGCPDCERTEPWKALARRLKQNAETKR